jgi:hypothetical protein
LICVFALLRCIAVGDGSDGCAEKICTICEFSDLNVCFNKWVTINGHR